MNSKYHESGQEIKPPFRVDGHGMFSIPADEDGFWTAGHYESLDDAIQKAREITLESLKKFGSVSEWQGMGDVGLVYDSQGHLVWSGREIVDDNKR